MRSVDGEQGSEPEIQREGRLQRTSLPRAYESARRTIGVWALETKPRPTKRCLLASQARSPRFKRSGTPSTTAPDPALTLSCPFLPLPSLFVRLFTPFGAFGRRALASAPSAHPPPRLTLVPLPAPAFARLSAGSVSRRATRSRSTRGAFQRALARKRAGRPTKTTPARPTITPSVRFP